VPFRAPDFATTATLLSRMFDPGAEGALWVPTWLFRALVLVAIGHVVGAGLDAAAERGGALRARVESLLARFDARLASDPISGWIVELGVGTFAGAFLLASWLLLLFFFAYVGTSPFIYFQF
jgi:hypothetical protein